MCDEWGIYDPERAGLPAVVRRVLQNGSDNGAWRPTTRPERHTLGPVRE
jgi:hypothetical protein